MIRPKLWTRERWLCLIVSGIFGQDSPGGSIEFEDSSASLFITLFIDTGAGQTLLKHNTMPIGLLLHLEKEILIKDVTAG